MVKQTFSSKTQLNRVGLIAISLIGAILLSVHLLGIALASSLDIPKINRLSSPTLPGTTAALTSTLQKETFVYSFSLASLGYGEATLTSPYDKTEYNFRLPRSWVIQPDGVLDLDISYVYDQADTEGAPAFFGNLTIILDNQTLQVLPIDKKKLDHEQIRVPLPESLLSSTGQPQHTLELKLDAGLICKIPHQAKLIIHPTSSISLDYTRSPLVLNLSLYPAPFYQQAFEPDEVRFVLPSTSTPKGVANILPVAAKLGDLTGNKMVISATTDLDFIAAPTTFDEHLIVIGQPRNNQLLPFLSKSTTLPVSLHQQQLDFAVQGPSVIAPGDVFTYVFTVTNTFERPVKLSLINPLPPFVELADCVPACTEDDQDNTVIWENNSLAPAKIANFMLTLKAADILTGTTIENTVTLIEAKSGPLNADTLTSKVNVTQSNYEPQISVAKKGDYFFVYNNRAVAEEDGIVQEIVSPWNEKRAILLITGLSDEAVQKASQAMSSQTRFPGMSGAVALIQDALPPSAISSEVSAATEFTFADLDYSDKVIQGTKTSKVYYYFEVPYGWQLTNEAVLDLYFSHSQLINENSGLIVLLNNGPVASMTLNNETADDGHIRINLANANVRTGQNNQLSIETEMSVPEKECADPNSGRAWLLIKNRSKVFLAHNEDTTLNLDFGYFPYPFNLNSALNDLLFVLPNLPNSSEWEVTLRLAASLGNSAGGKIIIPTATTGSNVPVEALANYHIIAIGRPSRNALLQQVNTQLPQPFLPNSDRIEQRLDDVIFRLPPDIALGYLQLIPSPWNEKRAFLAVTGTSDESIRWAVDIAASRSWNLKSGNLALIRDNKVDTIDTRQLTSKGTAVVISTVVPEMTAEIAAPTVAISPTLSPSSTPTPTRPASTQGERPSWLIPLVVATGLVVIIIFGFVFWQTKRRNSR